jgi:hypothetical protein
MKRTCKTCKKVLDISNFSKNINSKGSYHRTICKDCLQTSRKNITSRSPYSFLSQSFAKLKHGRAKDGIKWEIDINDVYKLWDEQQGKCAISGLNMTYHLSEGNKHFNASIDRIDNLKPYIRSNIQLVCVRVNYLKHTLDEGELYWWCKTIVDAKGNV